MPATRTLGGVAVPCFFYGTAWKELDTEALVAAALAAGFRGFDTANQRKHYFEEGVGRALFAALRDQRVARDDLFLQTKFTFQRGQDHRLPYDPDAPIAAQVAQSFRSSLDHLGVDRLDSLVLHGPATGGPLTPDDRAAWGAMESLVDGGRLRFLGISNVTAAQLTELVAVARIRPTFVQNRCYAVHGWDRTVRAVCTQHGLVYQGFSLLTANRGVLASKRLLKLAAARSLTPEQLVFAFALAVDMIPLTGSSDPVHLREDLAAQDVALTPAEVATIESLGG